MLTELTDEQAKYVGLPKQGPYKPACHVTSRPLGVRVV
jgi:hypothetical protein